MAYPFVNFFRKTEKDRAACREVIDFLAKAGLLAETIRKRGLFGSREQTKHDSLSALQEQLKKAQRICEEEWTENYK